MASALLDHFATAAAAANCVMVGPIPSVEVVNVIARYVEGGSVVRLADVDPLWCPPATVVVDDETPIAVIADVDVAVIAPASAVAETGSLVLVETDRHRRLVSLLGRTLVAVVPVDRVRPRLDDVVGLLSTPAGASHITLLTGPSRTADIERSLTIGVQGPAAVVVVLVDDQS